MFNFENLEVWQKAIDFAELVYKTTERFPDAERFGLTSQMRRAAVSVSSNLAEGSARTSRSDFARFIEISTGSLFEVVSQTRLALRQKLINEEQQNAIYNMAQDISRMSTGLRKAILNSRAKPGAE